MDNYDTLDLARRAIMLVLVAGAPVLATALIVGLIVSLVQAVTQVQDQTLTFVPKIIAVLVSMGMLMLPPVLVSLPFKLLLFVLADGWHLVVGTLMGSFG